VNPRRGSLVWVDLGQGSGSEQQKRRPAIVVSNDGANSSAWKNARGVITIVPVTSSSRKPYPFQVALSAHEANLPHDSIVQAEQVRSVDVSRIQLTDTHLDSSLMKSVDDALKLHLEL